MKILTIVGARPQFIKAAVVSRAFNDVDRINEVLVHTGQHYDENMSDIFFSEMEIPTPSHHLGIGGGTHGQNTGRMIEQLEEIMMLEKPDYVLVYGDTDSTLAGSIAAIKLHIPVAHVEAGLRSFNRAMPEEWNRILTDHASDLLFTPTPTATKLLLSEGIPEERIIQSGDVMFDAAMFYRSKAKKPEDVKSSNSFILATVHRAENTDNIVNLSSIIDSMRTIAHEVDIYLPMHPRTRKMIMNAQIDMGAIKVIDPISYLEVIWMLEHCEMVITDSGGLQKEAFFFRKTCITIREQTEWVELLSTGLNLLAGSSKSKILESFRAFKGQKGLAEKDDWAMLYGRGDAGNKIAASLNLIG